jgi:hypothetical protein
MRSPWTYALLLSAVAAVGITHSTTVSADGGGWVEVTVTNLTRGQVLSPPVVATHSSRLGPLFVLGEPASEEIRWIAEDAVNSFLIDQLEGDRAVKQVDVATLMGGPIPPGESASVRLRISHHFDRVSLVGMLVTTNDGMYAVRGARVPLAGSRAIRSVAYDAGTEANNEDCMLVPGPPCGSHEVRDTAGAEGFVHVHAGVHGIGPVPPDGLDPAQHDWRNPVAKITIKRLP